MYKTLRLLPIEVYSLILPALAILVAVFIFTKDFLRIGILSILKNSLNFTSLFGGNKLFLAFAIFWIIVGILAFKNRKQPTGKDFFEFSRSLLVTTIIFSAVGIITGITTFLIYYSIPEIAVLKATLLLDLIERNVFGNLTAVSLIKIFSGTFIEILFLYSYCYLFLIFSAVLILAAFINKIVFRKMLISFFVAFILSIPIWILTPATSPDGLYVANIFRGEKIDYLNSEPTSELFNKFNSFYHQVWIDESNNRLNVSSLPSLHTAWGLIAIFAIFKIKRKILPLAIAWFLMEIIGAIYALQHYSIDIIAGIIVGIFAIWLTEVMVNLETKYYRGPDYYSFCDTLKKTPARNGAK